jgi:glycosyltransferase involved in cell wall biosynthesis
MRILLINDYATPAGGAEIITFAIRDALRLRGHDARLFASSAGREGSTKLADYECLGTTGCFRTVLQSANPWAFWRLRRALKEFRPDVVHITLFLTQLSPLILPLLRRIPTVYYAVWYRAICPLGTKRLPDGGTCTSPAGGACLRHRCLPWRDWLPLMLQMRLWRRWRGSVDRIVANSEAVRALLTDQDLEVPSVIHHGAQPLPPRPPLSAPPMVVFAGRLVREKGVEVLVRAFARVASIVPEAWLFIAGKGPERERLERLSADLGVSGRVCMAGHLSRSDLEAALAGAWVQAVPSLWPEPFGLAAAEGMMRGTAVVASDTGGLSDFIRDGQTGLLVSPGDVEALAVAISGLILDPERAERIGAAGRAHALAHLGLDSMVDQFVRLYEELLRDRPHASAIRGPLTVARSLFGGSPSNRGGT